MGTFAFCPRCGTATESVMAEERLRDRCPTCDRLWYENAKPCAGAVVVEAGRVLLVRRAKDPFRGCWDLPGGFLEANEHPADGARREVLEETGLEVVLDRQLGMYVDTYRPGSDPMLWHHSLNIFFLARPVGGTLALSAETTEACWFKLAELPPLAEIAFENGRRALRDFLSLGQG